MKKLILSGVLGCFSIVSANSDVSGKEAFAGFNVGAGLNYVHSKADVRCDVFDPLLGSSEGSKLKSSSVGGYLSACYGDFVAASNWYVGLEFVADINKNFKKEVEIIDTTLTAKQSRFVPSVLLKVGRYISSVDALLFIGFGVCKNNYRIDINEIDVDVNNTRLSNKRIVPVVELGAEKLVADRFAVKASLSYRMPSSKYQYLGNSFAAGNAAVMCDAKNQGYVVRVGCVYHF